MEAEEAESSGISKINDILNRNMAKNMNKYKHCVVNKRKEALLQWIRRRF